jgi:hypothetical protein
MFARSGYFAHAAEVLYGTLSSLATRATVI